MKKIKEKGLDNNFVEISNTSVLDTDKQTELIKAVQEKGTDCKEMRKLARNYDCYIQEIAVQYKDQGLSLVELLEAGRIGLEEAATTFDPNRGSTFSSYAASSIQNKMDMLMESVSNLKNADMEYPTQNCFNILIDNAGDIDFSSSFGNKPMTKDRDTLISINATQYLKTKICNHEYVGIDIPVLLKPEGARENFTVVIVGESPLRDTKKTDTKNQILLGTPYALHQFFGCPSQCNVYKKILNDLLGKGYSIYLTDIIKIWWKDHDLKVNDDDKSIFDDEIKKVNNPIFVAWGERAAVKLKSLGYEFLQLPHPSKRNWNNWKLFIFEKAVYHKGVEYAKNIYPDENNSTTTEVIVANEAVEEIHEYCQNVSMCHQDQ